MLSWVEFGSVAVGRFFLIAAKVVPNFQLVAASAKIDKLRPISAKFAGRADGIGTILICARPSRPIRRRNSETGTSATSDTKLIAGPLD